MEAKDEEVKEWEEEEEEQEERGSTPVSAADASSQSPDPRQPLAGPPKGSEKTFVSRKECKLCSGNAVVWDYY